MKAYISLEGEDVCLFYSIAAHVRGEAGDMACERMAYKDFYN